MRAVRRALLLPSPLLLLMLLLPPLPLLLLLLSCDTPSFLCALYV